MSKATVAHGVAGLVAAFLISWWVGFSGYFFIDEAALQAQVDVLDDGSWTVDRPLPEFDRQAEHVPISRSVVVDDEYAPFAKHPLHVALSSVADRAGGAPGLRALSTLGSWTAAVAAACLARRGGRRLAVVTFWLTLLASPLVFHAQLVIAHALAAGLTGLAFVAADRVRPGRRVPVVALLVLGACLLRSEVVLLAGAFGLVLVLRGGRARRFEEVGLGVAAVAAGCVAYVGEPAVVGWIVGNDTGPQVISGSSLGGLSGRLEGIRSALVGTAAGGYGSRSAALVVLTGVTGVVAASLLRRRSTDVGPALLVSMVAVAAAVGLVLFPATVPGILWAFPFLLLGATLAGLGRRLWPDAPGGPPWALPTAGLFGLAVLLVQYEVAGGLEWGWRYVAVAIPLVTPWVASWSLRAWDDVTGPWHRVALTGVLVAFLLVPVSGIREQRRVLADSAYFADRASEVAAAADVDWVVSLHSSFGRLAYPVALDGRLVSSSTQDTDALLDHLAEVGADDVLVVWRDDREPPEFDPGPFSEPGERYYIASGFRAEVRSN